MTDLLTAKEAAVRLGVAERTVRLLIKQERLKAEKVGWAWLIREADLGKVERRPVGRPKKETTMTATVYTIPTSTEYWGADVSEEMALTEAQWLRAELQMEYPDVEFRLVPERQSWNNRAQGAEEVIETIRLTEEQFLAERDSPTAQLVREILSEEQ